MKQILTYILLLVAGAAFGQAYTVTGKATPLGIDSTAGLRAGINANSAAIAGKQATLVSGTNIKTVNGLPLLGSGNISITGGATAPAVTNLFKGDGAGAIVAATPEADFTTPTGNGTLTNKNLNSLTNTFPIWDSSKTSGLQTKFGVDSAKNNLYANAATKLAKTDTTGKWLGLNSTAVAAITASKAAGTQAVSDSSLTNIETTAGSKQKLALAKDSIKVGDGLSLTFPGGAKLLAADPARTLRLVDSTRSATSPNGLLIDSSGWKQAGDSLRGLMNGAQNREAARLTNLNQGIYKNPTMKVKLDGTIEYISSGVSGGALGQTTDSTAILIGNDTSRTVANGAQQSFTTPAQFTGDIRANAFGIERQYVASGTGAATTITIPHGLAGISANTPVVAMANNAATAGIVYVYGDAANWNIVYTTAPASATNNLLITIIYKP